MIDEAALRYLVLRQIWVVRSHVDPVIYDEVTKSLRVGRDGRLFRIIWDRVGESFEREVPRGDFTFYKRGDRKDSEAADYGAESQNLDHARSLAIDILGLNTDSSLWEPTNRPIRREAAVSLVWAVSFSIVFFALPGAAFLGLCFLLVLVSEWIPVAGRAVAIIGLGGFALAGYGCTAAVTGCACIATESLDPNPAIRKLRVAAAIGVVCFGLWNAGWPPGSGDNLVLGLVALVLVLPVVGVHAMTGTLERIQPHVFPVSAVGLAVDGFAALGGVVLILSVVRLLAAMFGYRILPMTWRTRRAPVARTPDE